MINNNNGFKGALAIIIASLLWGTTGTAASYSPNVSALAIGAFSMGFGGLLLVITARKKLISDFQRLLKHPGLLLVGALSVAIYPLAFYSSMRLSGVALGTVVSIATAPLFAAILERLIGKTHISRQWMFSFAFGAVGITLLALGRETDSLASNSSQLTTLGILLGCVAGLTYALYSWVTRRLINSGIHSQAAMSSLFGCAAILLIPSLFFTGDNLFSSSTNIFVSLYMAAIPMFLGYLLFSFGLNFIDVSTATLITLIEPLIATMLAVLIIGEKFKAIGWIGAILITICLLLQTYKPKASTKLITASNI